MSRHIFYLFYLFVQRKVGSRDSAFLLLGVKYSVNQHKIKIIH